MTATISSLARCAGTSAAAAVAGSCGSSQQLVAVAAPSPLPQQQNPGGQLVLVEGDDGCLAEMTAPALDEVQRVGAGVLLK